MNNYKTYEELKEELGKNYDLFMYEINLCLLQKIDKISNCLEENRKQYIYQDGLGEDWYFEDLDVFDELSKIIKGGNNE